MSDLLAKAVQELADKSATATAKAIREENAKTRNSYIISFIKLF